MSSDPQSGSETSPGDALTDDALAGPFRVLQRARGHRYSLDDTVTAWAAARARPAAASVVDLGCGIGSVLLMLAYKLQRAQLWGVEAQAESFALLEQNCARNGLGAGGRVRIAHGDLRDAVWGARVRGELPAAGAELVTGTPPYQPLGQGTPSPDAQRAHARVELRGGVEAYLAAGAALLAPEGALVVCADARAPARVEQTAPALGLAVCERLPVVPAQGKAALFDVWTLVRADRTRAASATASVLVAPFVARDALGQRSEQALELRRFFDLPVPVNEAPSPRTRPRRV